MVDNRENDNMGDYLDQETALIGAKANGLVGVALAFTTAAAFYFNAPDASSSILQHPGTPAAAGSTLFLAAGALGFRRARKSNTPERHIT